MASVKSKAKNGNGAAGKPNVAAGADYLVPEYHAHSEFTYYDFEKVLGAHRLPQPDSANWHLTK